MKAIFSRSRWILLLLLVPNMAVGDEGRYYALYRESEQRCLTVSDVSDLQSDDTIFGGPYGPAEALQVIREKCPVSDGEDAEWFAVRREQTCWLVQTENRLIPGDVVWDGNISRLVAEAMLLEHCDSFEIDDMSSTVELPDELPPEPVPDYGWSDTSVPWIQVYATPDSSIETIEVSPDSLPPGQWRSLSPYISIEPEDFASAPGGVRVQLPDTVLQEGEDPNNVVLAFFEEGWSQSGSATSSRWRLHAVDHDPAKGTFEAELHHASVIGLLVGGGVMIGVASAGMIIEEAARKLMKKKSSAHFVLHYRSAEIPDATVDQTLKMLENARRLLTAGVQQGGIAVSYPAVPTKLDVYYVDMGDKALYGMYYQGKSGARWIDLNLPTKVTGFNTRTLAATIAHELFHFAQFPYEGYSTLQHAWWGKGTGQEFPYGWLNEALSTWIELYVVKDPAFAPGRKDPICNADLYKLGLKGLKSSGEGYSAGLFVDFLVRRYGVEIVGDILSECKRQVDSGAAMDPVAAVRRAVTRRARQLQPAERLFGDLDAAWQVFSQEFIAESASSKALDNRVNRTYPFTAGGLRSFAAGEKASVQTWTTKVPPLSLVPLSSRTFKITPSERDSDGNALVDCTATFSPAASSFEISTLLYSADKLGKTAYFANGSRLVGRLDGKQLSRTFALSLRKQDRWKLLSFIPVGLGATSSSGSGLSASYTLSCQLRVEQEIPEFASVAVSSNAIQTYYRTLLNAISAMKANPGKRLWDVCPSCSDLYDAAEAEYAPLEAAMIRHGDQLHAIYDEWDPMTRLTSTYYSNIDDHYQEFDDEERRKIRNLVDIGSAIGDLNNACTFSPGEYIHLPYLFSKGDFPAVTNYLDFVWRRTNDPVPTSAELEKQFPYMREQFGRIGACSKALQELKPYLSQHKAEALRDVEELQFKHPFLQ